MRLIIDWFIAWPERVAKHLRGWHRYSRESRLAGFFS
jgi:hypothetical protein